MTANRALESRAAGYLLTGGLKRPVELDKATIAIGGGNK